MGAIGNGGRWIALSTSKITRPDIGEIWEHVTLTKVALNDAQLFAGVKALLAYIKELEKERQDIAKIKRDHKKELRARQARITDYIYSNAVYEAQVMALTQALIAARRERRPNIKELEDATQEEINALPLDVLHIGNRARGVLDRERVRSVGELYERNNWRGAHGLGTKLFREIISAMVEFETRTRKDEPLA